jgi:hypothetical protein
LSLSQTPPGSLNVAIPLSAEIPAPQDATACPACARISAAFLMLRSAFMIPLPDKKVFRSAQIVFYYKGLSSIFQSL